MLTTGAQFVLRLSYNEEIPSSYDLIKSGKSIEKIIAKRRAESKNLHQKWNALFAEQMEIYNEDDYYISKYAPFIYFSCSDDAQGTLEKAEYYASYKSVQTVYLVENSYVQNQISSASTAINLDDLRTANPNLDGSGVKIGVLESLGILDEDNENFTSLDHPPIVHNNFWYHEHVTEHATLVASIIGGSTGVAPGAQMYSVELYLPSNRYSGEMETLLDYGVNIINMSFSTSQINGECTNYRTSDNTSDDEYLNYIVKHDEVVIVAATGNSNQMQNGQYMCAPSSSPNVIAVGSTTDSGLNSVYSNYQSVYSTKDTPLLVAPGENITIDNIDDSHNGTSLSAPLVTGAIALLMQADSNYMILTNGVMSILAASSNYSKIYAYPQTVTRYTDWTVNSDGSITYDDSTAYNVAIENNVNDFGMYKRSGAGMLDIQALIDSVYSYNFGDCTVTPNFGTFRVETSKTKYISAGKTLSVGLAVLAEDNTRVGNYDIYIYNANGTLLYYTSGGASVIKKISQDINSSGYYTVKIVRQPGSIVSTFEDWNYSILIN